MKRRGLTRIWNAKLNQSWSSVMATTTMLSDIYIGIISGLVTTSGDCSVAISQLRLNYG